MKQISTLFIISFFGILGSAYSMDDVSEDLRPLLKDPKIPALSVAVIVDGKIVATGAAGIRKKGSPVPVTVADKFHLGSCTKSMTATLAAILVQEGKIRWDSTPAEIFKNIPIHEGYQKTTLHDLLTNTGGCPEDVPPLLWVQLWKGKGSATEQRLELVRGILKNPPAYAPGKGTQYSNAGFSIAGAMLEAVTGIPYETLLTEKLFKPLGMNSAGFRAPATAGKIDQPYGHDPAPVEPEPKGDNPRAIAPADAVHCSMEDWAKYAQFHLGNGPALLSREALEFLHAPTAADKKYAAGWIVASRPWAGGKALTHAGTNTTFYSDIWLAPEKNFAVVVACNTGEEAGFDACDEVVGQMIEKYLKIEP